MDAALHQYKLRLTNLSQSNRSLKLSRLSPRRDLDLADTAYAEHLSPTEIVQRIVAGRSVTLLSRLSASHEPSNLLDRRLSKIFRQVRNIQEETGTYDLFLGYPFVEGRFLDGSIARCPVLLFPVRLTRNLSGSPRWKLEVPKNESIALNNTFFLAYEKFQQIRLKKEFWETEIEHAADLQALLNNLYKFFRDHELALNFNSDLFQYQIQPFEDKKKAELEELPIGKLKFYPNAVVGVFPQSDSALLQDYEKIEADRAAFPLHRFFAPGLPAHDDTYIPEDQRYFVAPVDQSQEEALLAVKRGASVVVHGPPGTGKSQVILNLVADALARGQRVLVCSQKRAALDVVYQRLEKIGLDRYSALVHDYRQDRADIYQKIRRTIDDLPAFEAASKDLSQNKWERDFRLDARRIDEYNRFFGALHSALTATEPYGIAPHILYQLINPLLQDLPLQDLPHRFDDNGLRQLRRRMAEVLDYREFYADDYAWRYRLNTAHLDPRQESHFEQVLQELPGALGTMRELESEADLNLPDTFAQLQQRLEQYRRFSEGMADDETRQGWVDFYAQNLEVNFVRRKLEQFTKIFNEMARFRYLNDFSLHLYADLADHITAYQEMQGKFGRLLSLRYLKAKWYLNALLKPLDEKVSKDNFGKVVAEFRVLKQLMKHIQQLEGNRFFDDLPLMETPGRMLEWSRGRRQVLNFIREERALEFWADLKPFPAIGGMDISLAQWQQSRYRLEKAQKYAEAWEQQEKLWRDWFAEEKIEEIRSLLRGADGFTAAIGEWRDVWQRDKYELRQLDTLLMEFNKDERAVLDTLESHIVPETEPPVFLEKLENTVYRTWIERLERDKPELREVDSRRMKSRREDFREKVADRQQQVIGLILHQLKMAIVEAQRYNRLGNPVTYRDLRHQVNKKRLLWSIRKLVREFWNDSLRYILPCWLASPESVAAIFPMQSEFFDLIIFDEASQCYVERALPVILRGKQSVIAGDDKQLPPFDLYRVKVDEAEREIEQVGVALEVESVLDLARNSFTEAHLSWHYRSQEEELINFSNHAFYEGRLQVVPPARQASRPPIEFIEVDGWWENNQNLAEARRIIEILDDLVQQATPPSVGIVTFNFHQKELIADLLDAHMQELQERGKLERFEQFQTLLNRGQSEEKQGLFIKNIENVQGDERDLIIFSVAYAKDEQGKLVARFGLLNQKGGENRLNVAITRARKRIIVVCSFHPEQLKVDQAKHAGPRLFKAYLRYARAVSRGEAEEINRILEEVGNHPVAEDPVLPAGKGLAFQIAKALEKEGIAVEHQVGATNYRVDLAIPDGQGGYKLGIEVEGPTYFKGRSAKEREVYRLALLEARGWQIARVWARTGAIDPQAFDRLIQDLKEKVE